MAGPEAKLERAARQVRAGRCLVERQQALIGRLQRANADCSQAESLLATFERSLAVFGDLLRCPGRRLDADKTDRLSSAW